MFLPHGHPFPKRRKGETSWINNVKITRLYNKFAVKKNVRCSVIYCLMTLKRTTNCMKWMTEASNSRLHTQSCQWCITYRAFFHRQLALSANSDYQQQNTNSLNVQLKYQNLFAENVISQKQVSTVLETNASMVSQGPGKPFALGCLALPQNNTQHATCWPATG